MAKRTIYYNHSSTEYYQCEFDWPDNCFIRIGRKGKFIDDKFNVIGYFLEAYPRDVKVKTFIRVDGLTAKEVEESAWSKYQKYTNCKLDHSDSNNFERRKYTNGAGFCNSCGMFKSDIFEPSTMCRKCNKPTYHSCDNEGKYWCEGCYKEMPKELRPEWWEIAENVLSSTSEQITDALPSVIDRIRKAAKGD